MLDDVLNSGAIPALEAVMRFAGARQSLLANNIANLDTPGYVPLDVSPASFQKVLRAAVSARRDAGNTGDLRLGRSREVREGARGELVLTPRTPSGNILFHDRNNRDLERMTQSIVENATAYREAAELLRGRYALINAAIAERVY